MGAPALPALTGLRPRLGQAWYQVSTVRQRREAVGHLLRLVHALPPGDGGSTPSSWVARRVFRTETDATVAAFGPRLAPPAAVGRITRATSDGAAVLRNHERLGQLRADPRLEGLHRLLPLPLGAGRDDGSAWAVETAAAGPSGKRWLGDPAAVAALVAAAAAAVDELHAATLQSVAVDEHLLEEWVDAPAAALRAALASGGFPGCLPQVERVRWQLRSALAGRRLDVSWTHGDCWVGNVITGSRPDRVVGIIDWDAASSRGLPAVDLRHLLLTTRALRSGEDLGAVFVAGLADTDWSSVDLDGALPGCAAAATHRELVREVTLMSWLSHVTAVIAKRPAYAADRRWMDHNVKVVLDRA